MYIFENIACLWAIHSFFSFITLVSPSFFYCFVVVFLLCACVFCCCCFGVATGCKTVCTHPRMRERTIIALLNLRPWSFLSKFYFLAYTLKEVNLPIFGIHLFPYLAGQGQPAHLVMRYMSSSSWPVQYSIVTKVDYRYLFKLLNGMLIPATKKKKKYSRAHKHSVWGVEREK